MDWKKWLKDNEKEIKEVLLSLAAAILRECERYTLADHRYDLGTLCEEIRTAPAGAFVTLFSDIEESDGDSGCNGDFFASLADAAHSAALPQLKQVIIDHFQQEFSYV